MGRTTGPDEAFSYAKKGERGRGPRSTQSRTVMISKALSRLLRHQAVNEGVPITNDGWVRLDHLLAWKGLNGRNGVNPPPTTEEIWEAVEENEKKRFAVRWIGKGSTSEDAKNANAMKKNLTQSASDAAGVAEKAKAMGFKRTAVPSGENRVGAENTEPQNQPAATLGQLIGTGNQQHGTLMQAESVFARPDPQTSASTSTPSETQADTETSRAIAYYRNSQIPPPPSEFQIRATQGHSIQTVASDTSLLTPITLDDPASIPDTCVHGTFYGAWPLVLRTGGLKRMGRNHVHFASGPTLAEVGVTVEGEETANIGRRDKVISGMRHDAQLLIYIDLKRCLEDVKEQGIEMLWWKSENGVILTEGVETAAAANRDEPQPDDQRESASLSVGETAKQIAEMKFQGHGGRHRAPVSKLAQAQAQSDKLVPMKYWSVVVDIKGGHGVIWKQGEGTVKELPESLISRGTPKFRGRGRGRGGSR